MKLRFFPTCGVLFLAATFGCTAQSQPQTPVLIFKQDAKQLDEVSGLGIVRSQPNLLWMHNDSGDTARAFAINREGKIALTVNLLGAGAFDWEDMSAQKEWIYTGDIGDNLRLRQNVQILRFRSPQVKAHKTELNLSAKGWQLTTLRFPDGAHNCESLAVAPDGRILLVTKEENGVSGFFVWNKSWKNGTNGTMSHIASYKFGGEAPLSKLTTGADFSSDGRKLVVTTYSDLYEFRLGKSFDFASLELKPSVQELPAQEQCEAVCYSLDGHTIYSTSEGKNAGVWALRSKLK